MRNAGSVPRLIGSFLAILVATLATASQAQSPSPGELLSGVVRIKTFINPDARTIQNLGREREGSGIVIDGNGLVLTIGYLMVEAHAAEVATREGRTVPATVVGYDHESGFGLLQAIAPLNVRPMALGKSAEVGKGDPVLVANFAGAAPVRVAARGEFAGSWEYMLEDAIFTTPPIPAWSGAALVTREGRLVGIGSLVLGDAGGSGEPGNMFVPIDRLPPILGDLMADGHAAGPPKPWLGITTNEIAGRLLVSAVTPGGPAEKAGLRKGDIVVGVNGVAAKSLAAFYRLVWATGAAGAVVPLDVLRESEPRRLDVTSMNRLDHLKLKSTF